MRHVTSVNKENDFFKGSSSNQSSNVKCFEIFVVRTCFSERERERERERDRDRQIDRQTDRETDRQTETHREREREKQPSIGVLLKRCSEDMQ